MQNLKGVKLTETKDYFHKYGIVYFVDNDLSRDKQFNSAEARDKEFEDIINGKGVYDPYESRTHFPHVAMKIDIAQKFTAKEYFNELISKSNRFGKEPINKLEFQKEDNAENNCSN